jgi:hypothetical protein
MEVVLALQAGVVLLDLHQADRAAALLRDGALNGCSINVHRLKTIQ